MPIDEVVKSMQAKDVERRALTERLRAMGAASNVTTLHPAAMSSFSKSIVRLTSLLRQNPDDAECRLVLGNVIDSVMVHPTPKKRPYDISLYARMSAITGADIFHAPRSREEIVVAEGLPANFGLGNNNVLRLPRSNNREDVVLLSRFTFKTAA
jgi:site-specific DNA recombinase